MKLSEIQDNHEEIPADFRDWIIKNVPTHGQRYFATGLTKDAFVMLGEATVSFVAKPAGSKWVNPPFEILGPRGRIVMAGYDVSDMTFNWTSFKNIDIDCVHGGTLGDLFSKPQNFENMIAKEVSFRIDVSDATGLSQLAGLPSEADIELLVDIYDGYSKVMAVEIKWNQIHVADYETTGIHKRVVAWDREAGGVFEFQEFLIDNGFEDIA